jgi:hypothetical protein
MWKSEHFLGKLRKYRSSSSSSPRKFPTPSSPRKFPTPLLDIFEKYPNINSIIEILTEIYKSKKNYREFKFELIDLNNYTAPLFKTEPEKSRAKTRINKYWANKAIHGKHNVTVILGQRANIEGNPEFIEVKTLVDLFCEPGEETGDYVYFSLINRRVEARDLYGSKKDFVDFVITTLLNESKTNKNLPIMEKSFTLDKGIEKFTQIDLENKEIQEKMQTALNWIRFVECGGYLNGNLIDHNSAFGYTWVRLDRDIQYNIQDYPVLKESQIVAKIKETEPSFEYRTLSSDIKDATWRTDWMSGNPNPYKMRVEIGTGDREKKLYRDKFIPVNIGVLLKDVYKRIYEELNFPYKTIVDSEIRNWLLENIKNEEFQESIKYARTKIERIRKIKEFSQTINVPLNTLLEKTDWLFKVNGDDKLEEYIDLVRLSVIDDYYKTTTKAEVRKWIMTVIALKDDKFKEIVEEARAKLKEFRKLLTGIF